VNPSIETARQDLAYLRDLVEEGDWRRDLRFFGGTYLAIGLAILAQVVGLYVVEALAMPDPAAQVAIIAVWLVYSMVQTALGRRFGGKPATGLRGRAGTAGMLAMTFSHLTMLFVFAISAIRLGEEVFLQLAALVFFALNGGLWIILHALRRRRQHLFLAVGWFAATIAAAPFLGTPAFGLAVGIVVLALMVVPGIQMLRVSFKD
jgi:FtsH-binding integral membrane protein